MERAPLYPSHSDASKYDLTLENLRLRDDGTEGLSFIRLP